MVIFEQTLDWSPHVDEVVMKISRSIVCIRRIKSCLTRKIMNQLYFSFILPHIDYCCAVWGSLTKTNLNRLQRCQNKYARVVLNGGYYMSAQALTHALKWQSVEQRIQYHYCVLVYKLLHNLAPTYIAKLVTKRPTTYTTRYALSCQLHIPKPRTEYKKCSFTYAASKLFNELPIFIQTASSLQTFKNRVRQHQSLI